MTRTLLSFGHGYSASALARLLIPQGWRVIGTTRDASRREAIAATGVEPVLWPGGFVNALDQATDILVSAEPGPEGDALLTAKHAEIAANAGRFGWVGYLSTTGVYGNREGAEVDEDSDLRPGSPRTIARVRAERDWLAVPDLPVHVFRLAGIYGPGRGPLAKVRDGTARRIIKPGQMFSRIHVEDIARVLAASIARPDPGRIYNVCDDEPAPPEVVTEAAARLLGLPPPPAEDFATAEMTPMARSFYLDSRRVLNRRLHDELGVTLAYPTWREGLAAILAAENSTPRG